VTAPASADPRDEHRHARDERLRRGRYQAAPVARVWSEQADGGHRPLGKPTCADTSVQRAVALRLEAMDEAECGDGWSGCRPGRSPHAALQAWREPGRQAGLGGIVDAAVRGDCASSARTRRREGRRQRVHEGRRRRLMGPWRRAGVMDDGALRHPATGVGPGGVISPVLAQVVRQQVLDAWCAREGRPRMQGRGFRLRLADDCVSGGERAADARRLMAGRPTRCVRFGVRLHPETTRRMACRTPETRQGPANGHGPCDCRGVTHGGTPSRRGVGVITRRTASTRLRRTQQAWWRWGRAKRHAPVPDQDPRLGRKWRGPCRSSGLRGHCRLRAEVRRCAEQAWRSWLSRRRRTRAIGWEPCPPLRKTDVLPTPPIVHHIGRGLAGSHRAAPEWGRDAGSRGTVGVNRSRTDRWGGRSGNRRSYPEAAGPQHRLFE
jgi:hypothetical protein